jgi:hypothetical protein
VLENADKVLKSAGLGFSLNSSSRVSISLMSWSRVMMFRFLLAIFTSFSNLCYQHYIARGIPALKAAVDPERNFRKSHEILKSRRTLHP